MVDYLKTDTQHKIQISVCSTNLFGTFFLFNEYLMKPKISYNFMHVIFVSAVIYLHLQ